MGPAGQVAAAGVEHPLQSLSSPPLLQVPLKEDGLQDSIGECRQSDCTGQVDASETDILVVPEAAASHGLQVSKQASHLLVLCQHSSCT